jgi:hypothetical protein
MLLTRLEKDLIKRKMTSMQVHLKNSTWLLLELCHPHRKEITIAVNTLDQMGASPKLISAAMVLQGWKNFFGSRDWTCVDVQKLLQRHRSKIGRMADGTKQNII